MKRFAVLLAFVLAALPAGAQNTRFTLDAHDVDIGDVIRLIGSQSGRNVVADSSIKPQRISLHLRDVTFDEALAALSAGYGLQLHRERSLYVIGDAASMNRRFAGDAGGLGTQTRVLPLLRAHPEDVAPALRTALPDGTVIVPDKRTASVIVTGSAATIERAVRLTGALDQPAPSSSPPTRRIQLHNLKASDALKLIRSAAPENSLFADDRQNVVVVNGTSELAATIKELLAGLDAPGRQVMFEVRVAEVQPVNDSDNVGIQLGGTGFGSGALEQFPYTIARSGLVVNAQLNAMIQRGHASILAQPRVATLNNHEASLLVGEQYPVVTVNQQTGFPTVSTIDVGVRLRLTPIIGADGFITADLHPEYSQIIGFNNNFPILANRKLDATLRVQAGDTIVLGGLFQDIDSETVSKLPFLGSLPVLGPVFRNRQRTHVKDEVMFFITPRLLEPAS